MCWHQAGSIRAGITASSNTTAHGWKKPPAERWSTERATAPPEKLSDVHYIIVWTFFCQPEQLKALATERAQEADVESEQHRTELTKRVIVAWTQQKKVIFKRVVDAFFVSKRKEEGCFEMHESLLYPPSLTGLQSAFDWQPSPGAPPRHDVNRLLLQLQLTSRGAFC